MERTARPPLIGIALCGLISFCLESKNGFLTMTVNAPRPVDSSLRRAVIASPAEFLGAPASDSSDRVYTGRGRSAFVLQIVVSRVRPVEPHAQQFGLSRSCSQSLPEGGLAPRIVGVGQHLLALLACERSVQGRQRGCTPWAFRPSISRACRWVTRSAPGLSARVLRSTVAGGDRRFGRRWRGAEPLLTSSNVSWPAKEQVRTGGGLRRGAVSNRNRERPHNPAAPTDA
jgi:hypothetical protein